MNGSSLSEESVSTPVTARVLVESEPIDIVRELISAYEELVADGEIDP